MTRTGLALAPLRLAGVLCCLPLSGCGALLVDHVYAAAFRIPIVNPARLPADDVAKAKALDIFASGQGLTYTSKGPAKGFACKLLGLSGWVWNPPVLEASGETPETAAMSQLRLKAVQLGGNAVLAPACVHGDAWDWKNDCFDTWTCTGEAVVVR
jgi:hypothetical protein